MSTIRDIYRNGGTPISDAISRFYQAKDTAMTKRLMPEAMSGKPEALNQLMAINPQAGMQVQQNLMMQKQQAQQSIQQGIQNKIEAAKAGGTLDEQGNFVPSPDNSKPIILGEGQRLIDPKTFKVLAENEKDIDPQEAMTQAGNLRRELSNQSTSFQTQDDAYGRVLASATDPSAAGDLALIFNYMKVLDPGSTVREGEFATAEQAAGVPSRVLNLYNKVVQGERLPENQRGDFVKRSRYLYQSAAEKQISREGYYKDLATKYKIDPSDVVQGLVNMRDKEYESAVPKPAPAKVPDQPVKFLGFEK